MNTVLAPMYLSEIAPVSLRGGIGVLNQLAVTVGLFISQVSDNDNDRKLANRSIVHRLKRDGF